MSRNIPMSAYVEIKAHEVPKDVRFHVTKRTQGQVLQCAYGNFGHNEAFRGAPYMRVVNYTEPPESRITYYRLDIVDESDSFHNHE